jgi:hypothetical protein
MKEIASMKKTHIALATLAGTFIASAAHAQSSVTLFGMMDTGITYVSNQSGKSNVKMDDGVNGPNLWGMRGSEDLGGGTKAIFELVNQFQFESVHPYVASRPRQRPPWQVHAGQPVRLHDRCALFRRE